MMHVSLFLFGQSPDTFSMSRLPSMLEEKQVTTNNRTAVVVASSSRNGGRLLSSPLLKKQANPSLQNFSDKLLTGYKKPSASSASSFVSKGSGSGAGAGAGASRASRDGEVGRGGASAHDQALAAESTRTPVAQSKRPKEMNKTPRTAEEKPKPFNTSSSSGGWGSVKKKPRLTL